MKLRYKKKSVVEDNSAGELNDEQQNDLRLEKRGVQVFYDYVGWQRQGDEHFVDTIRHEDLRPVSKNYLHACHLRVNEYLTNQGEFLLDVASGPVPHPEYLTYSDEFRYHLCVDLSITALKEAGDKLEQKGLYVMGDITRLPFPDDSIDGIVSIHTIYHVPKDEQERAFREIWRVLSPGSTSIIIYHWGDHSLLMNVCLFPYHIFRALRKIFRLVQSRLMQTRESIEPKLYFHAHNYQWVTNHLGDLNPEIVSWRSVSLEFLKFFIHEWLFGRKILQFIFWLEGRFPHKLGRLGQYPLIVLKKPIRQ